MISYVYKCHYRKYKLISCVIRDQKEQKIFIEKSIKECDGYEKVAEQVNKLLAKNPYIPIVITWGPSIEFIKLLDIKDQPLELLSDEIVKHVDFFEEKGYKISPIDFVASPDPAIYNRLNISNLKIMIKDDKISEFFENYKNPGAISAISVMNFGANFYFPHNVEHLKIYSSYGNTTGLEKIFNQIASFSTLEIMPNISLEYIPDRKFDTLIVSTGIDIPVMKQLFNMNVKKLVLTLYCFNENPELYKFITECIKDSGIPTILINMYGTSFQYVDNLNKILVDHNSNW